MTTNYLSLSELAGRLERYERLPVPIAKELQQNIRRAAAASGISIPFYSVGTQLLSAVTEAWHGFLTPWNLIDFPAVIAQFLATTAQGLSPILLPLNVLGLGVIGVLYWRSRGFLKPLAEAFHWLGAGSVVVAAASALGMTLTTAGYLTNLVVALGLWILLLVAFLFIAGVCLSVLGLVAALSAGS